MFKLLFWSVALLGLMGGCQDPGCRQPATVLIDLDGEVKTPKAALAKVRELRASGKLPVDETAIVAFAPGVYRLDAELVLGKDDVNVRLVGAADGSTVISGGRDLGKFVSGADGIWRIKVPDGVVFDQLYVNGRRAQLAKEPNEFYHYVLEAGEGADKRRIFKTYPQWLSCLKGISREELANVRLRLWWSWNDELNRISEVDLNEGRVTLARDAHYDFFYWPRYCPRFVLENCRAALDAPGEWFLDRAKGELLYLPRPGETVATATAMAPVLPRLLSVDGARDVTFENLGFEANGWVMEGPYFAAQSAHDVGSAIEVRSSSRIVFDRCRVRHTANYGLWLDTGTTDSIVRHSYFSDLGAGGIRVGAKKRWNAKRPNDNMTRRLTIEDNIIHDGGHEFPAGTGIFITYTAESTITHNEICDLYYSGICCGWIWGYGPHPNLNNEISWNHIHHLGKGVLSDMGFVYMLGDSRGSVVMGNHGHDIFSYGYTGSGGTGLYPDEGTRGVLWTSNLIYRTKTSGLSQHYGRENKFINNIFAFPTKPEASVAGRWRSELHTSLIVSNNVFVWTAGHHAFGGPATHDDLVFGSNLWWSPDGLKDDDFMDGTFAAWQGNGFDRGSRFADPLFVDAAHDDFRLKPDSPALALGFRPWDYSRAGVRREDVSWRRFAESLTPAGYKVPPEPPKNKGQRLYDNDFEKEKIGSFFMTSFRCSGNDKDHGYVRITDAEAQTGKRSLEYRDFKGLKTRYWPHFNQRFMITGSTFVFRFAFKADSKANWTCEWRENRDGGYKVGPRFSVQNGKFHPEIPGYVPGEWTEVEITYHVSENAASTWDLVLVDSHGARHERKGLYCANKACRTPNWIGFLSNADEETVTYFDNWYYENCR